MARVTLFCDWDERGPASAVCSMPYSNPAYAIAERSVRWRIDFDTVSQLAQVRRATEDEIAGRADPEPPLCVPDEQLVLTHVQSLLLEERPWEERARDVLAYVTERLTRPG